MRLECVYINAQHFHDTVGFYEQLLQQKGREITPQRWVEFTCGHTLAVLHAEYERLKSLQISSLSPLYYVSITMPYWYFNITDPEGNVLEITGPYDPSKETV